MTDSGRQKLDYLLVGGFNSVAGYSIVVGLYHLLRSHLDIVSIGVIGNMLAISISFFTYKLLVFKTRGRWWQEYLRSYLVYGSAAVLNVLLLWIFVKGLSIDIWLAQGASMLITVVISYIGHSNFTFNKR